MRLLLQTLRFWGKKCCLLSCLLPTCFSDLFCRPYCRQLFVVFLAPARINSCSWWQHAFGIFKNHWRYWITTTSSCLLLMPRWPRVPNSNYIEVHMPSHTPLVLIHVENHEFDSSWGILLQAYNACVIEHLKCWQHLAHQCARDNIFLFRLRPKGHYHQHMGRDVERTRLNPRLVMSCMYDESFLGHIKRIAKACHAWTMVKERFWQRYLLLLALRFEEHRSCSR